MTAKEVGNVVSMALNQYNAAVQSGKPSGKERDRLKNILFDNVETIIQMADSAALEEKIAELEEQIEELTAENMAMNKILAAENKANRSQKKPAKENET